MTSFHRWSAISLLGIGHGLGDFIAGALLASLGSHLGTDVVLCYFIYNTLAFLGQPFAGLLCDRTNASRWWFYASLAASGLSFLIFNLPIAAVVLSGLASAFYHSSGGALAWELGRKSTLAAGLFAAPGVIGLAAGLAFGANFQGFQVTVVSLAQFSVVPLLYWFLRKAPDHRKELTTPPIGFVELWGSVAGWILLLAIAARSFSWSLGQARFFPPEDAIWLALSAAAGKALAGYLSDRFGARTVAALSLSVAAVFLLLSTRYSSSIFPAVTALQSGTAPMLGLVLNAWPRHPAFASGLAQGLAIAAGGAPLLFVTLFGHSAIVISAFSLVAAALLIGWRLTRSNRPHVASQD